jgi:hypothetical protein
MWQPDPLYGKGTATRDDNYIFKGFVSVIEVFKGQKDRKDLWQSRRREVLESE